MAMLQELKQDQVIDIKWKRKSRNSNQRNKQIHLMESRGVQKYKQTKREWRKIH